MIGSYITRACLERGWFVRGVDKITHVANHCFLPEFQKYSNFTFDHKDINDLEFLYDCDFVINTAAETHVGNSIFGSDEFVRSNIDGVHHLLKLIANFRGEYSTKPTLLHISTDEVYGDISVGKHVESDLLKPSNPYSATKAAADMLIVAWGRTHEIPYMIVRPTNNYGLGQYVEKLIPKSVKMLMLGRKIPLHNRGTPIRNWLHADDTANAIITLIEHGSNGEIYNISGNCEQSNAQTVAAILSHYFPSSIGEDIISDHVDYSYSRAGQDIRYALDDSKIRALGWTPTKQFSSSLGEIVDFYRNRFIW